MVIFYGLFLFVGGLLVLGLGRIVRWPLPIVAAADTAIIIGLLLLLAAVAVEEVPRP